MTGCFFVFFLNRFYLYCISFIILPIISN
jgi:hypothetical protein